MHVPRAPASTERARRLEPVVNVTFRVLPNRLTVASDVGTLRTLGALADGAGVGEAEGDALDGAGDDEDAGDGELVATAAGTSADAAPSCACSKAGQSQKRLAMRITGSAARYVLSAINKPVGRTPPGHSLLGLRPRPGRRVGFREALGAGDVPLMPQALPIP
jgi:hypothetical protein